jgi:hypothetical protein
MDCLVQMVRHCCRYDDVRGLAGLETARLVGWFGHLLGDVWFLV